MRLRQKTPARGTMKVIALLLISTALLSATTRAQDAAKAPAEGALTNFSDRNAKDVPQQVNRLTQEVFLLKAELTLLAFRQEFGDRIKVQRVWLPTSTADKEAIPA